ncbi:oxalate/formate MFS antiporter [Methylobacterium sp. C25]|uniref:oxalate/formate MFS antiporter n=1 Tax=Methylobacterium sp. C25 TaxID=2721622 RepID=UPI002278CE47|nr:oxalate/formate MFS antiporter [Methylobacterium sp. C25]MCE4224576.1 oxalate/formate MFS antiporter [Methylobacterium sp. C25]
MERQDGLTSAATPAATPHDAPSAKWWQLAFGVLCMAMIANLQYGWTLFVDPIDQKFHWGRAAIQFAFTLFVATETWLVPVETWFVDRYGPRVVVFFGGIMIGLAWFLNAHADSLALLYLAAVIGGIGAGSVYGTCVGNALKWFPHRRGLAAGATAAGFGAGAAITVVPIAKMIATSGYQDAFLYFGLGQGIVVVFLSLLLRKPSVAVPVQRKSLRLPQTKVDRTPKEAVRTPVFWVMYAMFVMVASGGLMAAAQIAPIAHDYKVADVPVSLFGLQMAALTFAISLDRIFDGFGRPFFGWVSDNIGRENTMFIAFSTAAIAIIAMLNFGTNPYVFVFATAVYFGVFGEIYSLFPATCGDTFGSKFAASNAGLLYTAKGTAAFLVPFASMLSAAYGWSAVFALIIVLNAIAASLAIFVLKPLRRRYLTEGEQASDGKVSSLTLA